MPRKRFLFILIVSSEKGCLSVVPSTWEDVQSGLLLPVCTVAASSGKSAQSGQACLAENPPRSPRALSLTQPCLLTWACTPCTSQASHPRCDSREGWGQVSSVATYPSWWSPGSADWSIPARNRGFTTKPWPRGCTVKGVQKRVPQFLNCTVI